MDMTGPACLQSLQRDNPLHCYTENVYAVELLSQRYNKLVHYDKLFGPCETWTRSFIVLTQCPGS